MFPLRELNYYPLSRFANNTNLHMKVVQTFSNFVGTSIAKQSNLRKQTNLPILYTLSGNTVAQAVHAHVASSANNAPLAFKVKKRIPEYNL